MKQYVVDAFTDKLFAGNPAAVCVMGAWPDEQLMMNITIENNFSETAFVVPEQGRWHLRWFTPGGEIDLCGHATLAAAFVLLNHEGAEGEEVRFDTLSGELVVRRAADLYEMDFPAYDLREVAVTDDIERVLGARPSKAFLGRDLLCVFDEARTVSDIEPDLDAMKNLEGLLCHVTEPGAGTHDCISRSFAPKLDVPEDPVCGSGHCHIAPYWARRLGKKDIRAYQASKRGGELFCRIKDDRVTLAGNAVLFSIDDLQIDR